MPLGKIGLDVSPANPRRIYASIEAPDSAGGIFRSDDGGDTWQRTTPDPRFHVRAWYYSAVTADPLDQNTVYVMNLQVWKSIDGGRTFSMMRMPHGDTHIMWVDPKDSRPPHQRQRRRRHDFTGRWCDVVEHLQPAHGAILSTSPPTTSGRTGFTARNRTTAPSRSPRARTTA